MMRWIYFAIAFLGMLATVQQPVMAAAFTVTDITPIDVPSATFTTAFGINDAGHIVGRFQVVI